MQMRTNTSGLRKHGNSFFESKSQNQMGKITCIRISPQFQGNSISATKHITEKQLYVATYLTPTNHRRKGEKRKKMEGYASSKCGRRRKAIGGKRGGANTSSGGCLIIRAIKRNKVEEEANKRKSNLISQGIKEAQHNKRNRN